MAGAIFLRNEILKPGAHVIFLLPPSYYLYVYIVTLKSFV